MLKERATMAIALLHLASGTSDTSRTEPIRFFDCSELARLRGLLISSGLINASGQLLRPLSSISLYEILSIVDEGIYPVRPDGGSDELPTPTRFPVYKHGMYRTMIRELLCRMKVSEL